MADKSMKAVIQAEVDPSGVVKGVAATNKELQKLNRTATSAQIATGISAGISMISSGYAAISGFLNKIDARVQELNAMAVKYSPEAMRANGELMVAKSKSEIAIGKAVGLGTAKGLQIEAAALKESAAKAQANAGDMAGGIASWESVKQSGADAWRVFSDAFIASMGNESAQGPISALIESQYGKANAGDVFSAGAGALLNNPFTGQGPISAMIEAIGNAGAGGIGSDRGMPGSTELAQQTELLRQISNSLKGGR